MVPSEDIWRAHTQWHDKAWSRSCSNQRSYSRESKELKEKLSWCDPSSVEFKKGSTKGFEPCTGKLMFPHGAKIAIVLRIVSCSSSRLSPLGFTTHRVKKCVVVHCGIVCGTHPVSHHDNANVSKSSVEVKNPMSRLCLSCQSWEMGDLVSSWWGVRIGTIIPLDGLRCNMLSTIKLLVEVGANNETTITCSNC